MTRLVRVSSPREINGLCRIQARRFLAVRVHQVAPASKRRFRSDVCAWHAIGIANDAATSYTLAKIVGFRRAMELMLTNRTLSAAEALEWGIVNRVYGDDEFGDKVALIARDLANAPTHLQAMAKDTLHMGWNRGLEECTAFEIDNVLSSVVHPHFKPCLVNFLDGQKSNVVKVTLP